ncbi:hypothetical protein [Planococcus shixiaomingii]|uniref:hypothetical protein n=1 Tax=Planococcus shixiaomingii TaxID=3058393 RepID=UPI002657FF8C|nr:hypothetical protein [Planococcus sp. N028]
MNEESPKKPEYKNLLVLEIKNGSIIISPPDNDPEASYPAYEVNKEENTKVEGEKKAINKLRVGDYVRVWTRTDGSEKEITEKIVVMK